MIRKLYFYYCTKLELFVAVFLEDLKIPQMLSAFPIYQIPNYQAI